jgi:hypothetical protein
LSQANCRPFNAAVTVFLPTRRDQWFSGLGQTRLGGSGIPGAVSPGLFQSAHGRISCLGRIRFGHYCTKAAWERYGSLPETDNGWRHSPILCAHRCHPRDNLNEALGRLDCVNDEYFGGEEAFGKRKA